MILNIAVSSNNLEDINDNYIAFLIELQFTIPEKDMFSEAYLINLV